VIGLGRGGTLVKVFCAWCAKEGRPAFLHQKAPFDDRRETHGVCPDHFHSLSAAIERCHAESSSLRFSLFSPSSIRVLSSVWMIATYI
jgi:hypothetical protein